MLQNLQQTLIVLLNLQTDTHRVALVPAAAIITTPVAYKVIAIKRLVVGSRWHVVQSTLLTAVP